MTESEAVPDPLHDDLLAGFRDRYGTELGPVIRDARSGLSTLRQSYRRGQAPPFDDAGVRMAYVLGYHPAHVMAAWWAYDSMSAPALGLEREELEVVCLGAGPAAEAVALARYAAGHLPALRRLSVHLIDRESGWADLRDQTLGGISELLPNVSVDILQSSSDLTDPDDLAALEPVIRSADLITAQTVLTELTRSEERQTVLDALGTWLGPDARLLIVDLHRVERGADSLVAAKALQGVRTFWECSQVLPLGSPPPLLRDFFWEARDGRRARTKVQVTARLLGRPGMASSFLTDDSQPTESQRQVLEAVPRFLDAGSRVAILTGPAGTGKTTLARKIAKISSDSGLPVRLLAPTGQAARRIGERVGMRASTIHSELYTFEAASSDVNGATTTTFTRRPSAPVEALWIVDEASMVGNRPYADRESDSGTSLVFGEGALLHDLVRYTLDHPRSKLLLIGDPHQLPPVEDGSWRPGLSAAAVRELSGDEPVCWELRDVTRQVEGSPIRVLAMRALAGDELKVPAGQHAVQSFSSALPGPLRDEVLRGDATIIAPSNAQVAAWNLGVRRDGGRGIELPEPGDRLLVCRNAPWFGLLNGDEVEVIDVRGVPIDVLRQTRAGEERRATLVPVSVALDVPPVGQRVLETMIILELLSAMHKDLVDPIDEALRIDLIGRSQVRPEDDRWYEVASSDERWTALRATYAYARTAHRAQGSEWSRVAVDTAGTQGGEAGRSWRYTAFTRARDGLHVAGLQVRATLDEKEFAPMVQAELIQHGFQAPKAIALANNKVQVVVESGGETVVADVHSKKGLPSTATVKNGEARGGPVGQVLNAWCRRTRAELRPLLGPTREWFGSVQPQLERQGFQVSAYRIPDYQFEVEAVGSNGGHARILVNNDGGGWPTVAGRLQALRPEDQQVGAVLERVVRGELPQP